MIKKIQQTIIIPETHAGLRLDQALAQILPDYSRTQLKNWIDSGSILVNGKAAKAKIKMTGGEEIILEAEIKPITTWEAQPIPLHIHYEDDDVLLINKPAGLVVHPGAGNVDRTLLNALLHHAPHLNELPRAGILHRLDKDTTGLLIIAKTASALKHLSHQLKKRTLVREYQAIVYGNLISGGSVDAPIDRHPLQRKRMSVIDTGKPALTHYRILEKYQGITRLKVQLATGRTHQIRVHMAYIHHPIIGDPVYGGRLQLKKNMLPELISGLRQFKRQALHAFALEFDHPMTHKRMRFEADLPQDMQHLIKLLRTDKENHSRS